MIKKFSGNIEDRAYGILAAVRLSDKELGAARWRILESGMKDIVKCGRDDVGLFLYVPAEAAPDSDYASAYLAEITDRKAIVLECRAKSLAQYIFEAGDDFEAADEDLSMTASLTLSFQDSRTPAEVTAYAIDLIEEAINATANPAVYNYDVVEGDGGWKARFWILAFDCGTSDEALAAMQELKALLPENWK